MPGGGPSLTLVDDQATSPGGWSAVIVAVAVRPRLWVTAVVQAVRLIPRRWWRTGSRLPWPAPAYIRFRSSTATGDPDAAPEPRDVIDWLDWCRSWRRSGL